MKNITKTLSERQQMRAASVCYRGMFDSDNFRLPQQEVTYKRNVIGDGDSPFNQELFNIMGEDDMLVTEVDVKGQLYKINDLIVTVMVDCDTLEAGLIKAILVKDNQLYFICKVYNCTRNWLQFFESQSCNESCKYVHFKKLADFKPLIKRGTTEKFVFVMHHRISVEYN